MSSFLSRANMRARLYNVHFRGLIVGLLLLAFALRIFRLGDQNVWWDEGLAIWAVRKSLVGATLWTAGDVHPPLFFWALWPWVRLAGQSEFAARYLTVIFGVLTCALGYALAYRLAGRTAGLLALALLAVARFEVWWSMELRMYMLAGTFVLLAAYAGVAVGVGHYGLSHYGLRQRICGCYGWNGWLIVYVLAAAGALYSVYLTAVALVGFNVAVVLGFVARKIDWKAFRAWLVAQVAVVILFVPWLLLALPRMRSWTTVEQPASLGFVTQLWATLLATGVSTDLDNVRIPSALFWLAALVAPTILLAYSAVTVRSHAVPSHGHLTPVSASKIPKIRSLSVSAFSIRTAFRSVCALLVLLLPPLAVWAATQPRAIFYSPHVEARYFVPFAGLVYVLIACLLAAVLHRVRAVGMALTGVVLAVLVLNLPGHYEDRRLRDEFQSMVLAIWTQAKPGDAVVLVSGNRYPIFRYYYDQPWDRGLGRQPYIYPADNPPLWEHRPPVIEFPDRGNDALGDNDWQERLAEIADGHKRVWLVEVDSHLQDPDDKVEGWLNNHRARVLSESYGPNALHLYTRDGRPPDVTGLSSRMPWMVDARRIREQYGANPVFEELHPIVGLPAHTLHPDDELDLTVFWLTPPEPLVVRLNQSRLEGQARKPGDAVQLEPEAPLGHRQRTRIIGSRQLPAGLYWLHLWPARYPVSGANADPENRRVILGTVTVK